MLLPAVLFLVGFVLLTVAKPLSSCYALGQWGDRPVPTYALFQAGGHVTGLVVFLILTPPEIRTTYAALICFLLLPVAWVSARVTCGITDYWPRFRREPVDFVLRADRYSAFGGLCGALPAYGAVVAIFGIPYGAWVVDAFCFGLLAGEAVSRMGCHVNGCCYGRPIEKSGLLAAWFAVSYRDGRQKAVWHGGLGGRPIFSSARCIALLNIAVLCLLIALGAESNPPAGLLGGVGLILYPYCRLINEGFRIDRNGFGKTFTYFFLPVLVAWGILGIAAGFQAGAAPRQVPEFEWLRQPWTLAALTGTYLVAFLGYTWPLPAALSGSVVQSDDSVVADEALVGDGQ